MTDIELIRTTHQMRQAQTAFFRSQDDSERRALLRESKRLERLVDAELRVRAPDLEELEQFVEATDDTTPATQ